MGQAHIHSLSLPALFALAAAAWTYEGGGYGVGVELRGRGVELRRAAVAASAWSYEGRGCGIGVQLRGHMLRRRRVVVRAGRGAARAVAAASAWSCEGGGAAMVVEAVASERLCTQSPARRVATAVDLAALRGRGGPRRSHTRGEESSYGTPPLLDRGRGQAQGHICIRRPPPPRRA
ncbi:hypothetical protein OsI_06821 [Oryza sativa Indica Group]|uniref:Uncharacterized protein n=1 Tax=Oryza sativa subsp. indica TaxID=39946 RepID=A2X3M8_ORYSI|nr:hypothetical protein OsI_06821 [Oryza sativa Indica Group]